VVEPIGASSFPIGCLLGHFSDALGGSVGRLVGLTVYLIVARVLSCPKVYHAPTVFHWVDALILSQLAALIGIPQRAALPAVIQQVRPVQGAEERVKDRFGLAVVGCFRGVLCDLQDGVAVSNVTAAAQINLCDALYLGHGAPIFKELLV
jgi:hypothetical protein